MTSGRRALAGAAFWTAFWCAFARLDIALDEHGLSQSKVWRRLLRTDTTAGKIATGALIGGGAAALAAHFNHTEEHPPSP